MLDQAQVEDVDPPSSSFPPPVTSEEISKRDSSRSNSNSDSGDPPEQPLSTTETALLNSAMDAVAVMLARKIHRNGGIDQMVNRLSWNSSDTMMKERRKLYPNQYETEEQHRQALSDYGVQQGHRTSQPTATSLVSSVSRQNNNNNNNNNNNSSYSNSNRIHEKNHTSGEWDEETPSVTASPGTSVIMTRHQTNSVDIWGRIPPKEPEKLVECSICHRLVNTLRFAPHLDKCMGIGTQSRATPRNGSS